MVILKYFNVLVFECKYELNSLAAFLEFSTKYYSATSDLAFFSQFQRTDTIRTILNVVNDLTIGTYLANGRANPLPYTFIRQTTSGTETMSNTGRGKLRPRRNRPLPLLLRALGRRDNFPTLRPRQYDVLPLPRLMCGYHAIPRTSLRSRNEHLASSLHTAIEICGIVIDLVYGQIYPYKVDGYGPRTIPVPLSALFFSYVSASSAVYWNTRSQ